MIYYVLSIRGVAQLGAHVVWDHGAAGSIPVTSTNLMKSCELVVKPITGFFVFKNNTTVMQCQRSLGKSKEVKTWLYSLVEVMRSLKKS